MTCRVVVAACVLTACHHQPPTLVPNLKTSAGSPPSTLLIRWHCGTDVSVNEAPRSHDEPIYVTENEGCPANDGLNLEYLTDVKLLAAGYTVLPTTNDFRKVILDDADAPPDTSRVGESSTGSPSGELVDGAMRRVFKPFHHDFKKLSAADRAHVHEQLGIDGVAQIDVFASKRCAFVCSDVSVIVSVTMFSLADYQPIWVTSCEARSSEKRINFLADDAARCAIERIPARGAPLPPP